MKLSEVLTQYMNDHDLSQRQFAAACGLSHTYVSFIINERNPKTNEPLTPSLEMYKKLADGMRITVQALFEMLDADSPVSLGSPPPIELNDEERYLLKLYRGAEDIAKEIVLETLANHQIKTPARSGSVG